MPVSEPLRERLQTHLDERRLVDTVERLVSVASPTGQAGAALDALADRLREDGFAVERPAGGHPMAPAVACRFDSRRPGPTLQFDGHMDVVHLPFVPPRRVDGQLKGSGACDMKGGLAAAVEALCILRESDLLDGGSILLTAHDLHEAPWGFGRQLDDLIRTGLIGDAVLIPEPLSDRLATAGRGQACWAARFYRDHPPVHEVMRPEGLPDVLVAGAELVRQCQALNERLAWQTHPIAGRSSVFVGQIHAGEIYNGSPQECRLEGTRRWVPGIDWVGVEAEFRTSAERIARESRTHLDLRFQLVRDAFRLEVDHPFVAAFDSACRTIRGEPLPRGPKPFVDDGNSFHALAGIPSITHGPRAGGQHTTDEWVDLEDLARVAVLYALTAVLYCGPGTTP